jgi:hypothetical protein
LFQKPDRKRGSPYLPNEVVVPDIEWRNDYKEDFFFLRRAYIQFKTIDADDIDNI